ncbi:PadR family transcriptional regulator [Streptomyces sp. NBC_00005]|uniref:PadR family transcriptional regulator n=1 Tax=Streptomyces sp. NBC_00005 TaxID=2903609 RepID=UPI0032531793
MTPFRLTAPMIAVMRVLLAAKKEEVPTWGLEICREADLGPGTVYPILKRLTEHGWVTSQEETAPNHRGPVRRFYELTEVGNQEAANVLSARDSIRDERGWKPRGL